MTYGQLRRLVQVNAETILGALTQRQFVLPHAPLSGVLRQTLSELGASPDAGTAVLERLSLNPATAIGRLTRCQIAQLARVLHREWRSSGED